jgi:hypothetical protein
LEVVDLRPQNRPQVEDIGKRLHVRVRVDGMRVKRSSSVLTSAQSKQANMSAHKVEFTL